VRDGGVGIPVREQRQVFDKFVRGAAARASDVGGAGVGLAMAKRIVEAHGGEITLESAAGAGSTFMVVLPIVSSQLPTTIRLRQGSGETAEASSTADSPRVEAAG
jgi:signal transduction histidine kinase